MKSPIIISIQLILLASKLLFFWIGSEKRGLFSWPTSFMVENDSITISIQLLLLANKLPSSIISGNWIGFK